MPNAYDEVSYEGYPFPQTHPDRLATIATLFGMNPASVERCRVLELGCGDGGNLIPMAFGLPRSEFVGIDLAARPIAKGQALVEALGLANIRLLQLDVMDVTPDLGFFDYIIAHGVYSWVPPAVQDKILAICKAPLAPQGVAYVSYNTYPAYHFKRMVRDMMRFHVRHLVEPDRRVEQGVAFLGFLVESTSASDTYGMLLRHILGDLLERSRESIYHDELAEINAPVHFHEFVEHAARHGLQFLSEEDFFLMQDRPFPDRVRDGLRALAGGDILLREQYLDFLHGRHFRKTLLCHREVPLDRALRPEQMMGFHIASPARPVSPAPDIPSAAVEEFRGSDGAAMATGHPLAKAAIMTLGETWPRSLPFEDLLAKSRGRLGRDAKNGLEPGQDAMALCQILLETYAAGLVELHLYVPAFVVEVSERPMASPLARLQARDGNSVTTLRHTRIQMDGDLERHLLLSLDGTRDRAALLRDLAGLVDSGAITVRESGTPVHDRAKGLKIVREGLEPNLTRVARLALLVA